MKILAVDTSCDDSCAAILDTDRWAILAERVHSHVDVMRKFGGVVPEIASREHLRGLPLAVSEVLEESGLTISGIDWFAATNRPGLIGALLVGVSFTKALAFAVQKPWTALHHLEAHLYSPLLGTLGGISAPPFPWVALVVSGGHTELFQVTSETQYRWLGGTLDDAAGEAFDKIGKLMGLPYPAGPTIDRQTHNATDAQRRQYAFPRAAVPGYDFSFSGLKTAVMLEVKRQGQISEAQRQGLLASAQEAILDALVQKARQALRAMGGTLVVTGGVACNSRLRTLLPEAHFPQPRHCTDNAAMVALLAALKARKGELMPSPASTSASARAEFIR